MYIYVPCLLEETPEILASLWSLGVPTVLTAYIGICYSPAEIRKICTRRFWGGMPRFIYVPARLQDVIKKLSERCEMLVVSRIMV
jgi:hypothetical protein